MAEEEPPPRTISNQVKVIVVFGIILGFVVRNMFWNNVESTVNKEFNAPIDRLKKEAYASLGIFGGIFFTIFSAPLRLITYIFSDLITSILRIVF